MPGPLRLEIKGAIPSFKNNKMVIAKAPNGKPLDRPLLITKPEFQQRMKEITDSIVSQLRSVFPQGAGQTLAASSIPSLIASSLPADDAWAYIPEIKITGELCEPGQEGATVTIERL